MVESHKNDYDLAKKEEAPKPKSERVKNALSKFKTLLLKKEVKIDASVSELTLFKRTNVDDETMRVEIEAPSEKGQGVELTMERK